MNRLRYQNHNQMKRVNAIRQGRVLRGRPGRLLGCNKKGCTCAFGPRLLTTSGLSAQTTARVNDGSSSPTRPAALQINCQGFSHYCYVIGCGDFPHLTRVGLPQDSARTVESSQAARRRHCTRDDRCEFPCIGRSISS